MLAIKPQTQKAEKVTANLLPCRINHDGEVDASSRYWQPKTGTGKNHFVIAVAAIVTINQMAKIRHIFAGVGCLERRSICLKVTKVCSIFLTHIRIHANRGVQENF
jgi:hypothetical protein